MMIIDTAAELREAVADFCERFDCPVREELLEAAGALSRAPEAGPVFERAQARYRESLHMDYLAALEELEAACARDAVPFESAALLMYIGFIPQLRLYYAQRGLPPSLCEDSVRDLKWKLYECKKVRGVWGSFVPSWFKGFFELTRFTFGRLQFELVPFPEGYARAGRARPQGEKLALNIHIPSSGPLLPESCRESFRLAADFYRAAFPLGKIPFVCFSWLLFPAHREFLPENARILQFMDFFDIYASRTDGQGQDLWRIFGRADCSDTASLPEETSLQRAYKRWLLAGNLPGSGEGLFFFEPSASRLAPGNE